MTRPERERLVDRFLEDEMTPAEEQEFIMRAATDRELFETMRAYRLVHRALRNDREEVSDGGHREVRERTMALLQTQRPAASVRGVSAAGATTPRGFRATWMMHLAFALICGVAGFLIRPAADRLFHRSDATSIDVIPSGARSIRPPSKITSSTIATPHVATAPAPRDVVEPVVSPNGHAVAAGHPDAGGASRHRGGDRTERRKAVATPATTSIDRSRPAVDSTGSVMHAGTPHEAPSAIGATQTPIETTEHPTRDRDSITFRARIKLPPR